MALFSYGEPREVEGVLHSAILTQPGGFLWGHLVQDGESYLVVRNGAEVPVAREFVSECIQFYLMLTLIGLGDQMDAATEEQAS